MKTKSRHSTNAAPETPPQGDLNAIPGTLRITALAGFLGLPHATVRDVIVAAGFMGTGQISVKGATQVVIAHFREKATRIDVERLGAQRRKEDAQANMAAMEEAKMSGELVSRADYENNYRDAIAQGVMRISRLKELNERQKEIVLAAIRGVRLAPAEGDEREA